MPPKIQKIHDPTDRSVRRGLFYGFCDVCREGQETLFLRHHLPDFLGLNGVDVAIVIAEAEGTVVAATHGDQPLQREVEASHQFLGEGRDFILLGIHCYCCHIV